MPSSIFASIRNWKDFERLCADLLDCEGYRILSEPYVDRTGTDLLVSKEYKAHDGDSVRVNWRVQCKHFAVSGNSFGRKDAEEAVNAYQATRGSGEGLLLVVDTDYSEEAQNVINKFSLQHPDARVDLWNQRQLRAKLDRHPHLLARYGIGAPRPDLFTPFQSLDRIRGKSVLMISDQSAFAHDLTLVFRSLSCEITFLPFWNYGWSSRNDLLVDNLSCHFDLVALFLGDSFGVPVPISLQDILAHAYSEGTPVLLFPFVAWSIHRGSYQLLQQLVPVRLLEPLEVRARFGERAAGSRRKGDYRYFLVSDSFAEDQYVELDPNNGVAPFTNQIDSRFGISHSYEYLDAVADAQCAWADTTGNPVVVVNDKGPARVCYLNTCCHSCMTTIPITSPLQTSPHFIMLVRNALEWLLP